jgi:hypothetical protein
MVRLKKVYVVLIGIMAFTALSACSVVSPGSQSSSVPYYSNLSSFESALTSAGYKLVPLSEHTDWNWFNTDEAVDQNNASKNNIPYLSDSYCYGLVDTSKQDASFEGCVEDTAGQDYVVSYTNKSSALVSAGFMFVRGDDLSSSSNTTRYTSLPNASTLAAHY